MKSIEDFDLKVITEKREYQKSPEAWDEQIFYFLLVDRFASEKEYPLYHEKTDYENAIKTDADRSGWKVEKNGLEVP